MSLRYPSGFISAGFNPLEVPNAPTIGTASIAGATSVSVTFTAPSNVGGSAITGYVATAKKTSDGTTISGTGSSSPITISGLTTGDAYTVTVAAVNSFGPSPSSAASNSVTPLDFELFSWGNNGAEPPFVSGGGQLGDNTDIARSSPVQVGSLRGWNEIACGGVWVSVSQQRSHSLAVKTDGTLWSWGSNTSGQLGQGNTTARSSPVQVGALTGWGKITAGRYSSLATKTDGTLWGWGIQNSGVLGNNVALSSVNSPIQIGALTNWRDVKTTGDSTAAIKTDGTLWSWGLNNVGQLGQGNTTSRSSPVQVGALTDWDKITAAQSGGNFMAIKTNGTLWGWGVGGNPSRIGDGATNINRSSPVQIGALTNWYDVAMGNNFGFAIKTDGTLWAWGGNSEGQLGRGNTTSASSPVQIGALTDWASVAAGNYWGLAIKNNGTLWSWGLGRDYSGMAGVLGLNDIVNRSSPTQVGSSTTWKRIAAGRVHSLATRA